ncbi:MAG: phosphate signaling complex protein PhoU [Deltaproteobacteria bacterium]|nr:phosphate signaling complex protein PhoU [Deltaproteobacteria bacterium]
MPNKHIVKQFEEELNEIKEKVIRLGGIVEKQIADAIKSLVDRESPLAEKVIEKDHVVNGLEVDIDELCLKVLATRQPAASDLRLITTAIKIIMDLERIGDEAVNISERAVELNREQPLKPFIDLPRMAEASQKMLKDSLDAFVNGDTNLAAKVLAEDDFVDDLYKQIVRELLSFMREDPQTITRAMKVMFIAKYLERIGDHATNIAEVVIFMVKGKVVRHMAPE